MIPIPKGRALLAAEESRKLPVDHVAIYGLFSDSREHDLS